MFWFRQQDDVRVFQILRLIRIAHFYTLLQHERLKIRKIGDVIEPHDRHIQIALAARTLEALRHAVLVLQLHVHPRHDAHDGDADPLLQHSEPGLQDFDIAAEFVDDDALDARPLLFGQ